MSRRQFIASYEEAIQLIKEVKASNDRLNRAIGVQSESIVAQRFRSQQSSHQDILRKLDSLIAKLQQSYLDPDTARKIGTAKQQYRIQKDRRRQIIQSIQLQSRAPSEIQRPIQIVSEEDKSKVAYQGTREIKKPQTGWGKFTHRESSITKNTGSNENMQEVIRESQQSYQVQYRMMKERSHELQSVARTFLHVQGMVQETNEMANQQGEKLDMIDEQLFSTLKNARQARSNLVEANDHHRRSRSKYVFLSLAILIAVAVAFVIILA